jgi:hypothetical protein
VWFVVRRRKWKYGPTGGCSGRGSVNGSPATERTIGLDGKIRYRAMRGAKRRKSLNRFLNIHNHLREYRIETEKPIEPISLIA